MKKYLLIIFFIGTSTIGYSQLIEAGLFMGGSNYIGDIGSTTYVNPNRLAIGAVAKYNWTPRIAFRGTLIYTSLHANDAKSNTPFRQNRNLRFTNSLLEGALGIEFSYYKYNMSKLGYRSTPYIIAQIGASNYSIVGSDGVQKRNTSLVLPLGVGYKMPLARNIGIAFESSFRYTFKDDIDGNNHSLPSANFGNPNSDDWYVFTGISVVYAFGRPGCYKDHLF
ncbi:DUF6089 family protein [Flavobacteriaceae bacterium F08102]|nr:DUF6089 family protein [Flavobacteriaceae bacterium F08102]